MKDEDVERLKTIFQARKDLMSAKHRELIAMFLGEDGNTAHTVEEIAAAYFNGDVEAVKKEFRSIIGFWSSAN